MIASTFGPTEMGIVLVIVLVLFGGSQQPKLAKNHRKAQKEFKDGLSEGQKEAAKEAAKSSDSTKSDDT